jgi:hypothetical protein
VIVKLNKDNGKLGGLCVGRQKGKQEKEKREVRTRK